ncbi:hypothetical protein UlMin_031306 [Ulmus minor]
MVVKQASHRWWFDNHDDTTSKRSPWLQSTLAELQRKTEGMLILIEGDAADSFAQRAEMFYKNRPELISMVEEFYRAHRSLAERYDHVKCDSATRLVTRLGSPFSATKYQLDRSICGMSDLTYDSYSVSCDLEDSAESEVDDPEEYDQLEDGTPVLGKPKEEEFPDEVRKMKEEMKRLEEENRAQKDQLEKKDEERIAVRKLQEELMSLGEENRAQKEQLKQKDEEKIAVIRQLSMAVDMLKEENVELRKCLAKESPKRSNRFDFNKLKGAAIFGNLFNGSQKHHGTIVAL